MNARPATDEGDTTPPVDMDDMTRFQIDLLVAIRRLGSPKGTKIKQLLEQQFGPEVHHSRIYPNLGLLTDRGLIEKRSRDARTNEHELTDTGERVLDERREWLGGEE